MRDRNDNALVVCSIENIDPMGVHTGDSVTVAPQQTLTDRQYQVLRDQALAVIRAVGVETGGSNIQFAVNPDGGEVRRDRDEPARVALVRARLEGDRVPDRQDRRPARGRLRARGDPERHHAPHAGLVRADDRLRGREDPALRLREVPARRGRPHHADEERGGGDGDRAHVQAGVHEGDALARAGRGAAPAGRRRRAAGAARAPSHDRYELLLEALRRGARRRGAAPPHRDPSLVPGPVRASWSTAEALGRDRPALARKKDLGFSDDQAGVTRAERLAPGCGRRSSRSTPARPSSRPRRPTSTPPTRRGRAFEPAATRDGDAGAAARQRPERRDPRLGAEPDRPGHRVRLLLRARRDDGARDWAATR